jgi:hypothetical protein
MAEAKSINLTIASEVYRDLRNIAAIRYMTGATDSMVDEFIIKLVRAIDAGAECFELKYKDPNYDASEPTGNGIAVKVKHANRQADSAAGGGADVHCAGGPVPPHHQQ